ncbi:response regulator transcription factor [Marinicella rhabdoformis]|uniref:response regulator transcription factor n=1 Tax=Marinicella rhabdoformis TaxID=2580566 RepID=UPI0012AEC228|nr:response regulator transcription factor [Marinicella rhabdoformis]
MKIYILEDDTDQALLLQLWLKEKNHVSEVFETGRELIDRLQVKQPDLLLLDWNLPGISGLDVMRWIKSNGHESIPIIFNSSRNSEEAVVEALTLGADDYLTKPVKQAELMARISAVSRRYSKVSQNTDTSPYEFLDTTNEVNMNDEVISLTEKEYQLAKFLFGNEGQITSRDVLLESIWSKSPSLSTRTVDTHISRLRKKLHLDGNSGWKLVSIYHKGYRLIKL